MLLASVFRSLKRAIRDKPVSAHEERQGNFDHRRRSGTQGAPRGRVIRSDTMGAGMVI